MEHSLTRRRPLELIAAGLGADQTPASLATFAGVLNSLAQILKGLGSPPRPASLTPPRGEEAWRSYAVYSGALSLRHYKSSRRLP